MSWNASNFMMRKKSRLLRMLEKTLSRRSEIVPVENAGRVLLNLPI
jgi:hypothetical protein